MNRTLMIRIGIVAAIVVVLAGAGAAAYYFWPQKVANLLPDLVPGVEEEQAQQNGNMYTSNVGNIRFDIPNGWKRIETATFPTNLTKVAVILAKENSACRIALSGIDEKAWEGIKQVSFGDRVFSATWQFDSSWYLPQPREGIEFTEERQYLAQEFRITTGSRYDDGFTLWSEDGAPVPDECNESFNEVLRGAVPYFEPISLTKVSAGRLFIGDQRVNNNEDYKVNVVFMPEGTEEKYVVMELPTGATPYEDWFVYRNEMYFVRNQYSFNEAASESNFTSGIYVVNPLTKDVHAIKGTENPSGYISSYYIRGDMLYYLAGASALGNCLDGYGECKASFYKVPLAGGVPVLLGSELPGGYIAGFNEAEQAFYLMRSYGDAGCSGFKASRFREGIGEEKVAESSSCYGEPGHEEHNALYESLIKKAEASDTVSYSITLRNGILTPDTQWEGDYRPTFHFK